jgi:regulator of replication initiation timing
MDVVEKLADFARRHREISHDWSGAKRDMHIAIAENCELALAEILRLRQDLSTAIERAAKVAEETQDKTVTTFPEAWRKRPSEYQEDLRKAIASSIRSLASPTMGDET